MKSCASLIAIIASSLVTFGSCSEAIVPPPSLPDTTSHNFTWGVDYLGDGAGSALYDVVVLSDSLVYAIGEIYTRDSLGNWDPNAFNLAQWNGREWSLRRIPVAGACNSIAFPPFTTIWAFGPDDLLLALGGSLAYFNGTNATLDCRMNSLLSGSIRRVFAINHLDIYLAGDNGSLLHFDGTGWQRLSTGTSLDITDIYGARHGSSGNLEILAVASEYLVSSNRRLLGISGATVTTLSDIGINYSLRGIWFVPGEHYYAVGSGIYEKRSLQEPVWLNGPLDITSYHTYAVRGTATNDVFVCGDFGEILHFNGSTWHSYLSQTGLSYGAYYALSVRGDEVIAVGENLGQAVVARGKRVK